MEKDHPTSSLFLLDGLLVTTQSFYDKAPVPEFHDGNIFPNNFTPKQSSRVTLHSLASPEDVICSTQGRHFTTKLQTIFRKVQPVEM